MLNSSSFRGSDARRRDAWLLAGALLAAAGLRVALLWRGRVVWGDEPFYLWLGRNWLTGRGYSFTGYSDPHHSPLYPLVSGLVYLAVGNLELASDILYVLFGALLALPVFLLARRLYGREVGLWAAWLVSFYPALTGAVIFWGTMTEPIYYFLVFMGFWALLVGVEDERLAGYAGAGAAFALAYLTRPEAIGYLAAAALFCLVVLLLERRLLCWRSLGYLGACGLVFLALIFPYAAYVHSQTGSWQVTEKAGVTFITCLGLAYNDVVAFDRATWGLDSTGHEVFFFSQESYNVSMGDYIRQHTAEFVRLVLHNCRAFLRYLFSERLFPAFLAPILILALFATPWDRDRLRREFLLWLTVLPLLGFALFFIQERYIGAALPTFAIWLALGLYRLGHWCANTWTNLAGGPAAGPGAADSKAAARPGEWGRVARALAVLPLVAVLAWFVASEPAEMRGTALGSFRPAHKTIGLWLHDRVGRDTVIMSRYPTIAFYADTVWRPTPNASIADTLEYARFKGVDYWVLDERETAKMRPQFQELLEAQELPAPLERIYAETMDGERMVVLRLRSK